MFAELTITGELIITAENETEGFAISQWFDGSCRGEYSVSIKPTRGLTLGPQPLKLEASPTHEEKEDHT